MSKCICGEDACVEVRDGKIIVVTYSFTIEVEVEKVKDVRLLRGNTAWLREC